MELPTDRPRTANRNDAGGWVGFQLGATLTAQLKALAREEGATLFMALLAGFKVLLSRYAGQDDIAVGTPMKML